MALKDINITVDEQKYDIPLDTKKKQINAPGRSSYSQPNHVYAMVLQLTDQAGNAYDPRKKSPNVWSGYEVAGEGKESSGNQHHEAGNRSVPYKPEHYNRVYSDR